LFDKFQELEKVLSVLKQIASSKKTTFNYHPHPSPNHDLVTVVLFLKIAVAPAVRQLAPFSNNFAFSKP